jgi:AcrR family transcriptional regulator
MVKGSVDRRVARTRAALQQAHIAMILEKGYEAITVEDICRAANVGRSTFYTHYSSMDDLKRRGLEQLRKQLIEHQPGALRAFDDAQPRGLNFSLPMFEHARDHIDLYRALVGTRGGTIALGAIRQILSERAGAELVGIGIGDTPDALPRQFVVEYIVGAYMAVLTWWLDSGAKLSPQRMDAMFRHLATEGVSALSNQPST